jgi:hypothetical protein
MPISNKEGEALMTSECGGLTIRPGSYKTGTYMLTYTGKEFYPLHPDPEYINIKDIAHALSNVCRFTGHVSQFYSVAQHCVLVSQICEPENALCGLLHDASEAYLSDVARPVKYTELMEGYREIEAVLEQAICEKFGTPYPMPKDVKYADDMCLLAEGYQLFKPSPAWVLERLKAAGLEKPLITLDGCWPPFVAKARFMKRFLELSGTKIKPITIAELDTMIEDVNGKTEEN